MPSLCSPDLQPQEDSKALPEAPKRESLIGLPDELLLCIADFLTQDDIACLSLCNKRLYRAFPLSESFMIRSGISQAPLLQRLERDLPTHITCHLCNILHKYDVSQSFGPKCTFEDVFHFPCSSDWYSREPLRLNVHHFVWRHVFYEFSFLHFQLAMKQLHHGPQYGISTETMSYTQVSLHPPAPTTAQRTFLVSIDAQVCHEHSSLVLRIQQIVFVPKSRRFLLYSNTRYAPWGRTWKRKSEPLGLFVCHHISDHELAGLITQSVNAYRTGNDRETVSPTYLCKQCKVNFCIEVSEHGTDLALVITRWLELEKDLTPNHQNWLKHAKKPRNSPRETRNASIDSTGEEIGARFCFENATARCMRKLLSRNIHYLKDERYKLPLYQFTKVERFGLWYTSKEFPLEVPLDAAEELPGSGRLSHLEIPLFLELGLWILFAGVFCLFKWQKVE